MSRHSSPPRGKVNANANPGGLSNDPMSPPSATIMQQQQLWSTLKLDPLLIAHATGLHRVLHDVQGLRTSFEHFSHHLLQMTKTGAGLSAHLQRLYTPETCPEAVQMMASAHESMNKAGVDWFASKFKNDVLNLFTDWIEDAEDVLSQLGLVQKTRHELDGLQEEVEKLFMKKLESPMWDQAADAALQKRLENSKEKLASACMLYDGQRRGVEKSMKFLLDQRAQLFHQVISAFMQYEFHFFRDWSAHAAAFVTAYPYEPKNLTFAQEPFGKNAPIDEENDAQRSACVKILTMPCFEWNEANADMEGESVKAIRRNAALRKKRDEEQKKNVSDQSNGTVSADVPIEPLSENDEGRWEEGAHSWHDRIEDEKKSSVVGDGDESSPISPAEVEASTQVVSHSIAVLAQQVQAASSSSTSSSPSSPLPPTDSTPALSPDSLDLSSPAQLAPATEDGTITPALSEAETVSEYASDEDRTNDVFVSPQPLSDTQTSANSIGPSIVVPNPSPDTSSSSLSSSAEPSSVLFSPPVPPSMSPFQSESAMLAQAQAAAEAAAAMNLPAKLLPDPRPKAKLHPALWRPVALESVKGSVWGKILVEHIQFDDETDEIREKYALLPTQVGIYEAAFTTSVDFDVFRERAQREVENAEAHARVARLPSMSATDLSPLLTSRGKVAPDRFSHMKTIDKIYVPPPPTPAQHVLAFPAAPYKGISSKQWYFTWQIMTRVFYPLTPEQVLEGIYKVDDKIISPDRVNALIKIWPTPSQIQTILTTDRPRPLTPIEALVTYLSIPTTPSLRSRLDTLAFQIEFGPICDSIEESLQTIEKAVIEVKKSQNFRVILSVLLHMGNFSNASHFIPPCYGFDIEWLGRLRHIRMSQSPSTLLDFLVYYLETCYPQLAFSAFRPGSFPFLSLALKVDTWKLKSQMEYVGEEYAKIKQMYEEDEYAKQNRSVQSPPSTPLDGSDPTLPFPVSSLPPRVPRFISYMQARATVIRHRFMKVKADLAELCKFLCIQPEEVFDPCADAVAEPVQFTPSTSSLSLSSTSHYPIGLTHLPPLGEVDRPPVSTAADLSSSSAASVEHQPTTHLRYNWQDGLKTLHKFISEFAIAHADYMVSVRTSHQR